MGKHLSSIWNLDLLCLIWCIWKECNRGQLRIWIARETSCLHHLVVLCLTSLGLGDSHLVIPSLCSLILFLFVINFFKIKIIIITITITIILSVFLYFFWSTLCYL